MNSSEFNRLITRWYSNTNTKYYFVITDYYLTITWRLRGDYVNIRGDYVVVYRYTQSQHQNIKEICCL